MPEENEGDRKVVLLCVHGTFARDANWIHADRSKLIKAVTAHLKGRVTIIPIPVQWSGRNRLADRWNGADHLIRTFGEQRSLHGDAEFIVIGHSHGGSVIVYAMTKSEDFRRSIRSVFLSTPFIDLKIRPELGRIVGVPFALLGYVAFFLTVYYALTHGYVDWVSKIGSSFADNHLFPFVPLVASMFLLGVVLYAVLSGFHALAVKWAKRKCAEYEASLATTTPPDFDPKSHLFVRCVGDEATAALAAAQFANWLSARMFNRFQRLLDAIDAVEIVRRQWSGIWRPFMGRVPRWHLIKPILAIVIVCPAIVLALDAVLEYVPAWVMRWDFGILRNVQLGTSLFANDLSRALAMITNAEPTDWNSVASISLQTVVIGFLAIVAFCVFAYGVGVLLLVICATLLFIVASGFGQAAIWRNLVLDIAVEPIPVGDVTLIQLNWDLIEGRLNHSAAYDHPDVHRRLALWI